MDERGKREYFFKSLKMSLSRNRHFFKFQDDTNLKYFSLSLFQITHPLSHVHTCSPLCSVTRFGKILPLWRQFTSLGKFLMVYFLIRKMLSLVWQICDIFGIIFFVANGHILKNNLTIWSHWPSVCHALHTFVLHVFHSQTQS